MPSPPLDWDVIGRPFKPELVAALRRHFDQGPFRIQAHQLAIEANTDDAPAEALLQQVAAAGALTIENEIRCPCDKKHRLTSEQAAEDVCPVCNRAFEEDLHASPIQVEVYVSDAPRTRDVRWMLALHGMNTRGAWQEAFNWLVSRAYRRSVPVAIYKYGIVRPGVILKFRQRALVEGLSGRIHRLAGESEETGFGGKPDVIAHSFGTWLLGHALQQDQSLKVGRVILAGCILRPDFDWAGLIARGQVEAVLCHTASKDFWARVAHYIIPDSGPAGVRGFNDRIHVGHATLKGGHHSEFFDEKKMPELFRDCWQPFLTEAAGSPVRVSGALPAPDWTAAWWPFRATILRFLVLALLSAIAAAVAATFFLGAVDLWHFA